MAAMPADAALELRAECEKCALTPRSTDELHPHGQPRFGLGHRKGDGRQPRHVDEARERRVAHLLLEVALAVLGVVPADRARRERERGGQHRVEGGEARDRAPLELREPRERLPEFPRTERPAPLHEPPRERLDERQLVLAERQRGRTPLPDGAEGVRVARLLGDPQLLDAVAEGGELRDRPVDRGAGGRIDLQLVDRVPRSVVADRELESPLAARRSGGYSAVAAYHGLW